MKHPVCPLRSRCLKGLLVPIIEGTRYGRIAKIILKEQGEMERAAKELNGTRVGDGDVV